MSYSKKLKDPRWQRRRLKALEHAGWECESCGDDRSTLHVHHKEYVPRCQPWDYSDEQLQALCEECHDRLERQRARLRQHLSHLTEEELDAVTGFAAGIRCARLDDSQPPFALPGREYAEAFAAGLSFIRSNPHLYNQLTADDLIAIAQNGSLETRRLLAIWFKDAAAAS